MEVRYAANVAGGHVLLAFGWTIWWNPRPANGAR